MAVSLHVKAKTIGKLQTMLTTLKLDMEEINYLIEGRSIYETFAREERIRLEAQLHWVQWGMESIRQQLDKRLHTVQDLTERFNGESAVSAIQIQGEERNPGSVTEPVPYTPEY
jgi:hypothetical protein